MEEKEMITIKAESNKTEKKSKEDQQNTIFFMKRLTKFLYLGQDQSRTEEKHK